MQDKKREFAVRKMRRVLFARSYRWARAYRYVSDRFTRS